MTNPIDESTLAQGRGMEMGETRTIPVYGMSGGKIDRSNLLRTITIRRTDRPYAYDLCDAYNEGLNMSGAHWTVGSDGGLKFGTPLRPLTADQLASKFGY